MKNHDGNLCFSEESKAKKQHFAAVEKQIRQRNKTKDEWERERITVEKQYFAVVEEILREGEK